MAHHPPGHRTMNRPPSQPRREIPEPTYHWPGGPSADDDPTPVESALAALKFGAILAAGMTIAFFYLATYSGYVVARTGASLAVLAAFVLPSVIAFARTTWARRRRRPTAARAPKL